MKQQRLIVRILICVSLFCSCLYSYLNLQNDVTEKRIYLPVLAEQVKAINEKNTRLEYEIDRFENPLHLMQLLRLSEYSHLKHPYIPEILTMREGDALELLEITEPREERLIPALPLAIGTK